MGEQHQICYFPYLFLRDREAIEFEDIVVWNFSLLKSKRIRNKDLRSQVSKLLSANRQKGKIIRDMGVIAFGGKDNFASLTQSEKKKIGDLRRVLFLSCVAESNTRQGPNAGNYMATTENFSVSIQNFVPGKRSTGYFSGIIVRINDFGYEIGKLNYEMPYYVLSNRLSFDEDFIKSIKKLKRENAKTYRRILRATDAMMNGYYNSDDISSESRILQQTRAFEILFNLPDNCHRKHFKSKIEKFCQPEKERKLRYKSERKRNVKEWEYGTRHAMWADRFYSFRNHIAHGEVLKKKESWFFEQAHHDLGLWFFLVAVKQIINDSLGKKLFYDTIRTESGKFIYDKRLFSAAGERYEKLLKKTFK